MGSYAPSPLASGEFCPHPLKGSFSKSLIKYLQLKFINRLILLPRHELSIVTQIHKWGDLPHPLKGSYSKTLIKYLQLKFINRLILLPRHELSIVTQIHKWGDLPHPRWLAGSFAPIP